MSFNNLDEAEKSAVVALIKQQCPYRKILKKFPALKSTSMISRIKREHLDNQKPKPREMSERRKRQISKQARQRYIAKNSEIIIEGLINILDGFKYCIRNLEEIEKSHAQQTPELIQVLNTNKNLLKKIIKSENLDSKKVIEVIADLSKSAKKVNSLFFNSVIRIKAIAELRKQFESFMKYKIDVEVLDAMGKIIEAFVMGCEALFDEDYVRYRNMVMCINEATTDWFIKYEGECVINEDNQTKNENQSN